MILRTKFLNFIFFQKLDLSVFVDLQEIVFKIFSYTSYYLGTLSLAMTCFT